MALISTCTVTVFSVAKGSVRVWEQTCGIVAMALITQPRNRWQNSMAFFFWSSTEQLAPFVRLFYCVVMCFRGSYFVVKVYYIDKPVGKSKHAWCACAYTCYLTWIRTTCSCFCMWNFSVVLSCICMFVHARTSLWATFVCYSLPVQSGSVVWMKPAKSIQLNWVSSPQR